MLHSNLKKHETMKYNKYITAILAILLLASCGDYLDRETNNEVEEKDVFIRFEKVNELVTDVYARAKKANRPLVFFEHFGSAGITDECEGTNVEGNVTNLFNNGAWNPNSLPGSSGQYWWDLYSAIRKTNLIIEGVVEYNTPDDPRNPGYLNIRIGEVYFMRAYFHLMLVRMYGEAPYLDWKVKPDEKMDFERESVHTLVEKIVKDAQEAFKRVPANYPKSSEHFGRVDQGACLGLISIARWIAATPLWNGAKNQGYEGVRIHEAEYGYDAQRWQKALDAAKDVINFEVGGKKRYSLYSKYTANDFGDQDNKDLNDSRVYKRLWEMFYDTDSFEQEWVFFVTRDKDQGWQGDIYPPSRDGSARQQPVQEQVDEYEYIAGNYGYPIYSAEARKAGYNDENPYAKGTRDPRFYRDILYHGAPYRDNSNNSKALNIAGGKDAIGEKNATSTGYYLRKFQREAWNKSGSFQINAPAIWRLPEFIYIYAEAANILNAPDKAEAIRLINEVRTRSFMKPMPPSVEGDSELLQDYIQRERRVEFFYENKRVWNARLYLEPSSSTEKAKEAQWRASAVDNSTRTQRYWKANRGALPKCQRMINGMRPVKGGDIEIDGEKYRMERFCVEERIFQGQHYLFPLMQSEINKTGLQQNPGW